MQRHPIGSLCVTLLRLKLLVAIPICLGQFRFLYLYKLLVLPKGIEPSFTDRKSVVLAIRRRQHFVTFELSPELPTVPTYDLEVSVLEAEAAPIFDPLYFGLLSE